jgi:hypothetical protein
MERQRQGQRWTACSSQHGEQLTVQDVYNSRHGTTAPCMQIGCCRLRALAVGRLVRLCVLLAFICLAWCSLFH